MDFKDKKILITGGTRGIGRAAVEAFLRAGARVAVNGSSDASVAKALAELGAGDRAVAAPGNLGLVADCRRVAQASEIAKSILYLASDLASFVTGSTHAVDGGVTARAG
jgi:NAD(P)-dependent dehydrogenase (short-subunit alcohol dehydrogenase family)